jgi:hypothetical protein
MAVTKHSMENGYEAAGAFIRLTAALLKVRHLPNFIGSYSHQKSFLFSERPLAVAHQVDDLERAQRLQLQ